MGDFSREMMGGGPPLVPIADVPGWIPGMTEDLADGASALSAAAAIMRCTAREIPAPHIGYYHLVFTVGDRRPPRDAEGALRLVASVAGDHVPGAPLLGNTCGDVPASQLAAALREGGFVRTADAYLRSVAARRAQIAARMLPGPSVWEVPERHLKSTRDVHRCLGLAKPEALYLSPVVAVGLSLHGETPISRPDAGWRIPGVPYLFDDLRRAFRGAWRETGYALYTLTPEGEARLREHLTEVLGPPRELRAFGLDE